MKTSQLFTEEFITRKTDLENKLLEKGRNLGKELEDYSEWNAGEIQEIETAFAIFLERVDEYHSELFKRFSEKLKPLEEGYNQTVEEINEYLTTGYETISRHVDAYVTGEGKEASEEEIAFLSLQEDWSLKMQKIELKDPEIVIVEHPIFWYSNLSDVGQSFHLEYFKEVPFQITYDTEKQKRLKHARKCSQDTAERSS